MSLTKEQILSAQDIKTEKVNVPEWGGPVFIKALSGTERDAYERRVLDTKLENIRAALCALSIVDEQGNRLFSDSDIAALGAKSGSALTRIFARAQKLNKLTAKDFDELTKNSESDQSDSSTSASQPI